MRIKCCFSYTLQYYEELAVFQPWKASVLTSAARGSTSQGLCLITALVLSVARQSFVTEPALKK